jgi:hypothetical protein
LTGHGRAYADGDEGDAFLTDCGDVDLHDHFTLEDG